jgi:hypothetical protein
VLEGDEFRQRICRRARKKLTTGWWEAWGKVNWEQGTTVKEMLAGWEDNSPEGLKLKASVARSFAARIGAEKRKQKAEEIKNSVWGQLYGELSLTGEKADNGKELKGVCKQARLIKKVEEVKHATAAVITQKKREVASVLSDTDYKRESAEIFGNYEEYEPLLEKVVARQLFYYLELHHELQKALNRVVPIALISVAAEIRQKKLEENYAKYSPQAAHTEKKSGILSRAGVGLAALAGVKLIHG